MSVMLIVAGFLAWLLAAVAIGSALVYGAAVSLAKLRDNRDRLVRADERRECGNRLIGSAWWFSEDKRTMDVLMAAGHDMLKGLDPLGDVSNIREQWRKAKIQ